MTYLTAYTDFLKKHVSVAIPLTIVCDCSNGPTSLVIHALKDIPNVKIITINDTLDPDFPAHGPNPLEPGATDQLKAAVLEHNAHTGFVFDADGDRMFMVDETGTLLPSFITSVLLFKNRKPPYIADETVYKALEHLKVFSAGDVLPSKVGSFYVKEKLKEAHGSTGAEFSGHFYFNEFFHADSGIFAMIVALNIIAHLQMPISEFVAGLPPHVLVYENVKAAGLSWDTIAQTLTTWATAQHITVETREGITLDTGSVWLNVRLSNTEPLLRFIGGSTTEAPVHELISQVRACLSLPEA